MKFRFIGRIKRNAKDQTETTSLNVYWITSVKTETNYTYKVIKFYLSDTKVKMVLLDHHHLKIWRVPEF